MKFLLKFLSAIILNLVVMPLVLAQVIDVTNITVSEDTKQKVRNKLASESSAAYRAYVDYHTPSQSSYSSYSYDSSSSSNSECDSLIKRLENLNGLIKSKQCEGIFNSMANTGEQCYVENLKEHERVLKKYQSKCR